MSVEVQCPKCNQRVAVSDDTLAAGNLVACPRCKTVFPVTVPAPAASENGKVHPLVWAALGGGTIAVLALVIGLTFGTSGNSHEEESQHILRVPQQTVTKPELAPATEVVKVAPDSGMQRLANSTAVGKRGAIADADILAESGKPPGESSGKEEGPNSVASKSLPTVLSAEDLYDRVAPSVVTIKVNDEDGEQIATGSGFFIDEGLLKERDRILEHHRGLAEYITSEGIPTQAGYVLTNFHVIRPAVSADVILFNGDKGTADSVIAEDEKADLALLAVCMTPNQALKGIPLALDDPRILATVYAIGSPKGLRGSASEGKVSGFREFSTGNRWMQTTAAISPGSSGSPLLLADGTLAGVATLTLEDAQNVNFAVPVSKIRAFLSSKFRHRDLAEGASIRWHEQDAFDDTHSLFGPSHSDVERKAAVLLDKARQEMKEGFLDDTRQKMKHFDQAIALAQEAGKSLPGNFKYLAAYIIGKSKRELAYEAEVQPGLTLAEAHARYLANQNAKAALHLLAQLTKSNPDFSPGFESLVLYYQAAGDWPDALLASNALVKLMPRCAHALRMRARCYEELNRIESARNDLQAAVELAPRDFWLHYDLARVLDDLGDYAKAIASYETAEELQNFNTGMVQYAMGIAHRRAGNFEKAISAFKEAKALGQPAVECDREIAKCKQRQR